jgi:Fe-S oxidoreductase
VKHVAVHNGSPALSSRRFYRPAAVAAGTYSVLQPALATQLRDRKLTQLGGSNPECIVSANVGCIQHLQSGTALPVRHWIEVVDEALQDPAG